MNAAPLTGAHEVVIQRLDPDFAKGAEGGASGNCLLWILSRHLKDCGVSYDLSLTLLQKRFTDFTGTPNHQDNRTLENIIPAFISGEISVSRQK